MHTFQFFSLSSGRDIKTVPGSGDEKSTIEKILFQHNNLHDIVSDIGLCATIWLNTEQGMQIFVNFSSTVQHFSD